MLNKLSHSQTTGFSDGISNHHVYALNENEPWLLLEVTSTIRFWLGPRLVYSSIQQKNLVSDVQLRQKSVKLKEGRPRDYRSRGQQRRTERHYPNSQGQERRPLEPEGSGRGQGTGKHQGTRKLTHWRQGVHWFMQGKSLLNLLYP